MPASHLTFPYNQGDRRCIPESTPLGNWALPLLRDKRDVAVVQQAMSLLLTVLPLTILMYLLPQGWIPWWAGVIYAPVLLRLFADQYVLMLHVVSHRGLFKNRYKVLNHFIPIVLAPFFGQTPYTYYAHHIGMHHIEDNLDGDLSSTLRMKGDSRWDFARYAGRFFFMGPFDLVRYFRGTKRKHLGWLFLKGEFAMLALVVGLAYLNFQATFACFIMPLVVMRLAMMQGNWGQHAFVNTADPKNHYTSSVTLLNSRHNRRCFNDGYHVVHHIRPNLHWTEMPAHFEANIDKYRENDAIVFSGINNFNVVWQCLMAQRWEKLADHFVDLREEPRSREEIIALLKRRAHRIPDPAPVDIPEQDEKAA